MEQTTELKISGSVRGEFKMIRLSSFDDIPENFGIISIDYYTSFLVGIAEEIIYNGKHYYGNFRGYNQKNKTIEFSYVNNKEIFFEIPLNDFLNKNWEFKKAPSVEPLTKVFEPIEKNSLNFNSYENFYNPSLISIQDLITVNGIKIYIQDSKFFVMYQGKLLCIIIGDDIASGIKCVDSESRATLFELITNLVNSKLSYIGSEENYVKEWFQVSSLDTRFFSNIEKNPKNFKTVLTKKLIKSFEGLTENGYILVENDDNEMETLRLCDFYRKA